MTSGEKLVIWVQEINPRSYKKFDKVLLKYILCFAVCKTLVEVSTLLMDFSQRIQDLFKGSLASETKSCQYSGAEWCKPSELSVAGLKGPGSFWIFNGQICILLHSRDSFSLIFDIHFNTKS